MAIGIMAIYYLYMFFKFGRFLSYHSVTLSTREMETLIATEMKDRNSNKK